MVKSIKNILHVAYPARRKYGIVQMYSYVCMYMGSSIETVAFQVYEILKINHEFLQFF